VSDPLSIGLSPCPNDTFMFHGLLHGLVPLPGFSPVPHLLDVEELNRRALSAEPAFAVTKLSAAAFARARGRYELLDAGAALGRGCGPLVVRAQARGELGDLGALAGRRVAIPGEHTTAALLLRLFAPSALDLVAMRFDAIVPAVAAGAVDAGVIIHESRFTYREHGLAAIADLGALWEEASGLPIALGVVAARRDLGPGAIAAVDEALRASIVLARARPDLGAAFVRSHARELSDEVCRQHIELYVTDFSVSLGATGRSAIERLLAAVDAAGP